MPKREIFFISPPRTGTHTVRAALDLSKVNNHISAKTLRARVGEERWAAAFSFVFVRNPFDKIASWYFYHQDPAYTGGSTFYKDQTFRQWVLKGCRHHWKDRSKAGVDPTANPIAMRDWVCDDLDHVLTTVVYRVEDMNSGLRDAAKRMGREPRCFPKLNVSRRPKVPLKELFDEDMVRAVVGMFWKDFELFGYGKEIA